MPEQFGEYRKNLKERRMRSVDDQKKVHGE
jgi:hypothetical protein